MTIWHPAKHFVARPCLLLLRKKCGATCIVSALILFTASLACFSGSKIADELCSVAIGKAISEMCQSLHQRSICFWQHY